MFFCNYRELTLVSLDFNPESDTVNPSASTTGADGPGVGVDKTGAFAVSAASAAAVNPINADPATPTLINPFNDCFQFS
jgi:hypothetical protein